MHAHTDNNMKHAGADDRALSMELCRPCRTMRVWLPLQLHGVGAFRRCYDELMDLSVYFCKQLEMRIPGIVTIEPDLCVVAFRYEYSMNNNQLTAEGACLLVGSSFFRLTEFLM